MSISEDAVAMHGHSQKVKTTPISTSIFFGLLKFDRPPGLSSTVKPEHQKNRGRVTEGKITSWGEHGRVAIVTDENNISAAFFNHELDFPMDSEDDGSIKSIRFLCA